MKPASQRILSATTGRSGGPCQGARDASPLPHTGAPMVSGISMGEDA
jgi:hypothetical protein